MPTATPVERTDLLESLWDEPLTCQSNHEPSLFGVNDDGCTVVVTHSASGCVATFLICESRALFKIERMRNAQVRCSNCNRQAADCWRIVPI